MTAPLAKRLKALADPLRLRMVAMLTWADFLNVCDFVSFLEASQPLISRNLRVLREAGWVTFQKKGQRHAYSIAVDLPHDMEILEYALRRVFASDEYQKAREALERYIAMKKERPCPSGITWPS